MSRRATWFVVGWYADGVRRTHHVTTDSIVAHMQGWLTGFLPFSTIAAERCDDMWTCDHRTV